MIWETKEHQLDHDHHRDEAHVLQSTRVMDWLVGKKPSILVPTMMRLAYHPRLMSHHDLNSQSKNTNIRNSKKNIFFDEKKSRNDDLLVIKFKLTP